MTATAIKSPTQWANGLGYGGLIPFVGLALAIWLLDPAGRALSASALLGYGAIILSFLGAIHWGFVMRDATAQPRIWLVWSVTPSLMAWVALLLNPINPTAGLCLLAAGLWGCFAVDWVVYHRIGAQTWLPMRLVLTMVASLSCVAGALGSMGVMR